MKTLHLRGARGAKGVAGVATLAAAALALIGYQTAMGSENAPRTKSSAAASSWKVSYYGKGLEARLTDLAAVSANEGWALGRSAPDFGEEPEQVLLHRAGGKWKKTPLPEGVGDGMLSEIEASGADNVWLFGQQRASQTPPFAYRWDGKAWHKEPAPPTVSASALGSTVTVQGPDDVWVLGDGGACHWDGKSWTTTKLPHKAQAIAGSAPDDVWAVGFRNRSGNSGPLSQPATMHWDGKSWKSEKTPEYNFPDPRPPEESAGLDSVVAVSKNEVWALGDHSYNHGEGGPEPKEETILLRWDGKEWKKGPAKATDHAWGDIASDGAGGLVFGRSRHWTANGEALKIGKHKPVPGRSGKVKEIDKKQKFYPDVIVHVPGTRQVWSAGVIELGAYGDANFRRGAVLSYDTK
jgi:hypothetical protein